MQLILIEINDNFTDNTTIDILFQYQDKSGDCVLETHNLCSW